MPERIVGGRVLNAPPENPYSTASQVLIEYLYDYYNRKADSARFFTSNKRPPVTDSHGDRAANRGRWRR